MFDIFLSKQVKESPTDILVSMLCQRIEAEALTTDAHLVRSYYDSHLWRWPEKGIAVSFDTESYAKNAAVASVDGVSHNGNKIELNDSQKARLRGALNTSQRYALRKMVNEKKARQELAAIDAISSIVL